MVHIHIPVTVEIDNEFNSFLPQFMNSTVNYDININEDNNIYEIVDAVASGLYAAGFERSQVVNGFRNYISVLEQAGYEL